jgi:hypothetical protein
VGWGNKYGQAQVDPDSPRCWGSCDQCGRNFNLYRLRWQFQYAGTTLINQRFLVCDTCWDKPAPFLKTIIIPPDPKPVLNPRPEPYAVDENNVRMVMNGLENGVDPRVTEDDEAYRIPDNSVNDADEDPP